MAPDNYRLRLARLSSLPPDCDVIGEVERVEESKGSKGTCASRPGFPFDPFDLFDLFDLSTSPERHVHVARTRAEGS